MSSTWSVELKVPKVAQIINRNESEIIGDFLKSDKEVVIISLFGTSPPIGQNKLRKAFQLVIDSFGTLQILKLNQIIESSSSSISTTSNKNVSITGFYNEDESLIILNMEGGYDSNLCLDAFREFQNVATTMTEIENKGFLDFWLNAKSIYFRGCLLLFSISHIVILSQIGTNFDTNFITLFKSLQQFKNEAQEKLSSLLETVEGIPDAWINHARFCSPRLLFFFNSNSKLEVEDTKRLKNKLQKEIYAILRKCRIITNISSHSLFSISPDPSVDFVYICNKDDKSFQSDKNLLLSTFIFDFCRERQEGKKRSESFNEGEKEVEKFRRFLSHHLQTALLSGFDDNIGGGSHKNFFILPQLGHWAQAYNALRTFLLDSSSQKMMKKVSNYIDKDSSYIDMLCDKNFTRIMGIYTKNCPMYYSLHDHSQRLKKAMDGYMRISRSPTVLKWIEKLELKAEGYWKRGRQQCESQSLFETPCVNPLHIISPSDHLEVIPYIPIIGDELDEMDHKTSGRLVSACNCGRSSISRDEPFTIREANFGFYDRVGQECGCAEARKINFPIFEKVDDEGGGGSESGFDLEEMLNYILTKNGGGEEEEEEIVERREDNVVNENQEENELVELLLSDKNEEGDGRENNESEEEEEFLAERLEKMMEEVLGQDAETDKNSLSEDPAIIYKKESEGVGSRNKGGDEYGNKMSQYLPGMVHSKSPRGFLPLFPSWSLLVYGPASSYAHNIGIYTQQPGFVSGSAYLLPWDVSVKAEEGVTKPASLRSISRSQFSSFTPKKPKNEFSVKIFLGFEYECRRGHRFMIESSEKVLNFSVISTSAQKEMGQKISKTEKALYFKCPCSSSSEENVAQLMRIHIVTPKAPVYVTLNPKVQFPSIVFTPGHEEPIKLAPNLYWILRLPLCYVSEERVFVPPLSASGSTGKFLKGAIGVVCMRREEVKKLDIGVELKSLLCS